MTITVTPLSDVLGAAVTDIDLSRELASDTISKIKEAWHEYTVLVFPNQSINDEQQEKFCRHFGELELVRTTNVANDHPHVMMITNVTDTGKPTALEDGEMMFHYDQCYYERPCLGATLYSIEVPDEGGNTLFANCTKAYEALPQKWKNRISSLKALNYYNYGSSPTTRPENIDTKTPQWVHPVVRIHSETGQKALYVSRLMSMRIQDVSTEESDEILYYLFDHMEQAQFVYEHIWSVGELLMWDNRCSVHARTYFAPEKRRMMRRVTVRDPVPVI
tara:strand:+ start:633 stop:1460 length:828 start_codon:yes stop_codon:yes gene_type:complete